VSQKNKEKNQLFDIIYFFISQKNEKKVQTDQSNSRGARGKLFEHRQRGSADARQRSTLYRHATIGFEARRVSSRERRQRDLFYGDDERSRSPRISRTPTASG
jgi:hypothetical protein